MGKGKRLRQERANPKRRRIPRLVRDNHIWVEYITTPDARRIRLLYWSLAEVGVEHHCYNPRAKMTTITAPLLLLNKGEARGHTITGGVNHPGPKDGSDEEPRKPVTVRPSILCADCGLHGYITDGVWTDA